jgi:hypothetical protein
VSAQPALGARGAIAGVLSAAADWLVEPVERVERRSSAAPTVQERQVVAVVGLAPRCGTTTVARAVGAELAGRDPCGASAVTAVTGSGALPLGMPAAGRLARTLAPVAGGATRACGRLCLVHSTDRAALAGAVLYLAPLVLDVDDPQDASAAASVADRVLLVAGPRTEPALAAVVARSLSRVGPEPLVVVNRAEEGDETPWSGRGAAELPDSRMGAQLALAGREARGTLGCAVALLADRIGEVA